MSAHTHKHYISSNPSSNLKNEESKDCQDNKRRPSWDNKIQYLMAALGFAVGLGNIWRFPYLCKKNGGGAFLLPYILMLFIVGYPIYYLELAVGQKIRKGSIGVWLHINPYLGGVGFASNAISLLIGLYYNMILGWALFYFYNSFQTNLPWSTCPLLNNSEPIPECNLTSPTTYFWYRQTLDISYKIENGGELNWRMVVVLMVAWIFIFFGMVKGIKSSGKIMYFATSFPYLVLIAFFIRALTLDGAIDGITYMFSPNWKLLLKGEVWRDAATQIFFSLGLGYGSIIAYSSYNPPKNNCYRDTLFIASANCFTSIFASIIVFSILGFKAKLKTAKCLASLSLPPNVTSNCSLTRELDTDVQGTGLAFIAFTEAILQFPLATVWSLLFFFMILNIGVTSEFGILQTVVTTVLDSSFKISKPVLSAVMCTSMFIVGLMFTQRSGSYFLDIFDSYSATISLLTIAIFEVIAVSYVYGIKRFMKDLEEMVGVKPGWYWRISWMLTTPAALVAIWIASLYDLFSKAPTYEGWNPMTGKKDTLPYPSWAYFLIVFLILVASSCIPLVALLHHFKLINLDRLVVSSSCKNQDGVTESTQPLTTNSL